MNAAGCPTIASLSQEAPCAYPQKSAALRCLTRGWRPPFHRRRPPKGASLHPAGALESTARPAMTRPRKWRGPKANAQCASRRISSEGETKGLLVGPAFGAAHREGVDYSLANWRAARFEGISLQGPFPHLLTGDRVGRECDPDRSPPSQSHAGHRSSDVDRLERARPGARAPSRRHGASGERRLEGARGDPSHGARFVRSCDRGSSIDVFNPTRAAADRHLSESRPG